ncbi:MAG: hypothetical protein IJH39_04235, partial [Clostridia bacterium]|nr:hypothetical protein [Clostridia bacterium]
EKLPLKYKVSHLYTDGAQTEDKEIEGTKPQGTNHFEYEDVLTLDYPVDEYSIITLVIKDKDNKELRTLEINMKTREITVKGEKEAEKISEIELKKYLNLFSELNNDWENNDCLVAMAEKLITVGGEYEGYGIIPNDVLGEALRNNSRRELINKIVKEIYGEKAEFEMVKNSKGQDVEIVKGLKDWDYSVEGDSYMSIRDTVYYGNGHCLKIEDISYSEDIYTVKYVYLLANNFDEENEKLEDLEQYETTIKLKRNENNQYSKYQIVSLEKGTKIKDKVSTKIEEQNFFKEYKITDFKLNDLTNAENGKIAIAKSGEEQLKTTQKDGYYVYTDRWNNSYNIKRIKDVKSVFTQFSKDKNAALYKCTMYYVDNNDKNKEFDVAVVVSKTELEAGIIGTYDNYTGSTEFTRFVGLYQDDSEESIINNTTSEDIEKEAREIMDRANWKQFTTINGATLKLPKNFSLADETYNYERYKTQFFDGLFLASDDGWGNTSYWRCPVRIKYDVTISENMYPGSDAANSYLTNNDERMVESKDQNGWTNWYPTNNGASMGNGSFTREYGRVGNGQFETVTFTFTTNNGCGVEVYKFMNDILESINSKGIVK